MQTAKPIVFIDFDGTICHDRYWRSLSPKKHQTMQKILFGEDTRRVNDWMLGKYTAEEINRFLSETLDIPYERLWQIFVNDCITMRVSQKVLEDISALRKTFTAILITGNMDSFSRWTAPVLQLENYFDVVSNSYYEQKSKIDADGEIFIEYAEKYGASIKDCIVIDDSTNVCSVFEALGGTAYKITPERDIEYYLNKLESHSY